MTDYVIIGTESQSYVSRSGDPVSKFFIIYLNPFEAVESSFELGHLPLKKDILANSDFSSNIFSQVPALYDLGFRLKPARVGRRDTVTQKLVSVSFLRSFQIDPIDERSYLILFARYYNYTEPQSSVRRRGIRFFAIDPLDLSPEGYSLLAFNYSDTLDCFGSGLPGYYNLELSDRRGLDGDSTVFVDSISYSGSFDFSKILVDSLNN